MDRKSIIASLDILSQNFKAENDPIAKDLRTMAYAISKMGEEELQSRLAAEAPDFEDGMSVEAKKKMKMIKCPACGGKVMEQTGYCMSCKDKIENLKGKKEKKAAEEVCPKCKQMKCTCMKEAEASVNDFWTKEASDAVAQAIIADVMGPMTPAEPVKAPAVAPAKTEGPVLEQPKKKDEEDDAADVAAAVKKDAPAEKRAEATNPAGETEKHEKSETPAEETAEHAETDTADKGEKAEEKVEKAAPKKDEDVAAKIVETDILKTSNIYDIELTASDNVDQVELTADEKARLSQLFIK
jgi:DNA-directed RNA polymerase subunit RPC12/RpoP